MKSDSSPSSAVLDIGAALGRLGGDRELYCEIIGFFLEDAPPLLAELRRAADVVDAAAVRSTAHALKGLAAGCGGVRAAEAAQRVESLSPGALPTEIAALLAALDNEFEQLRRAASACRAAGALA